MKLPARIAAFFAVTLWGSAVPAAVFWPALPKGEEIPVTGSWAAIRKLYKEERKIAEALKGVETMLKDPVVRQDPTGWARALIWKSNFQIGLGQAETALADLQVAEWPKTENTQFVLRLYWLQSISNYLDVYDYEIRQRTRTLGGAAPKAGVPHAIDLKRLSQGELTLELRRSYAQLWKSRGALGKVPVGELAEFVTVNSYPRGVRGSLRDFLSYLIVADLRNESRWTPTESGEARELKVASLWDEAQRAPAKDPDFERAHPLRSAAQVLGDLRTFQLNARNSAGAIQAQVETAQLLSQIAAQEDDDAWVRNEFGRALEKVRAEPWYAWGAFELAQLWRSSPAADAVLRAREWAQKAAAAKNGTEGAANARQLLREIERPDYSLQMREADGGGYRSLEITHRNLDKIYLRFYRYRPEEFSTDPSSFSFQNYRDSERAAFIAKYLRGGTPEKSYTVSLPATGDYRNHRTFFAPTGLAHGFFLVFASGEANFPDDGNLLYGTQFIQSDLYLLRGPNIAGGQLQLRVFAGDQGIPLAQAQVELYKLTYDNGRQGVSAFKSAKTDANGIAAFAGTTESVFAMVTHGKQLTRSETFWADTSAHAPDDRFAGLLYTDRSVYRPAQPIEWKLLLYETTDQGNRAKAVAGREVTLELRDLNGQAAGTVSGKTNAYGSVAGRFAIPTGKALGQWSIVAKAKAGLTGAARQVAQVSVRVEEYKRPTFFAEFLPQKSALSLNKPAQLTGQAKYYFGAPVTDAKIKWKVTRSPRLPQWWEWWGSFCTRWGLYPDLGQSLIVASGETNLRADGTFDVDFVPAAKESPAAVAEGLSFNYQIDADIVETSGETRSAARTVTVGFRDRELGFGPLKLAYREGEPAQFDVKLSQAGGEGTAGTSTFAIYRLQEPKEPLMPSEEALAPEALLTKLGTNLTAGDQLRDRVEPRYGVSLGQSLALLKRGANVLRGALTHDARGAGRIDASSLPAGMYRVELQSKDGGGRIIEAARDFVRLAKATSLPLPLVVVAPEGPVRPGTAAQFFIDSGFRDAKVFFEVKRRGTVKFAEWLNGRKEISIAVGQGDRGGLSYRVTLVRKHESLSLVGGVNVPREDHELRVSWDKWTDRLQPGAKETWTLKIQSLDPKGNAALLKQASEVLVSAYDQSLDIFEPSYWENPAGVFANEEGLSPYQPSIRQSTVNDLTRNSRGRFGSTANYVDFRGDTLKRISAYSYGGLGSRARVMFKGGSGLRGNVVEEDSADMAISGNAMPKQSAMAPAVARAAKDGGVPREAGPRPVAVQIPQEMEVRKDFRETAFWLPRLLTDPSGAVKFEFTAPDSVTRWKVRALAHSPDLSGGFLESLVETSKDFLVRPQLPRFLREGDDARIQVVVNNNAKSPLAGKVSLDIFQEDGKTSAAAQFGHRNGEQAFNVPAGASQTLEFILKAPAAIGLYEFVLKGAAQGRGGQLTDGERRLLPVLPGRQHFVQSRVIALKGNVKKTVRFDDMKKPDPSRIDDQLIVTLDGQMFLQSLKALPYLWRYPYEGVEQTLNRFLPTAILGKLYELDAGIKAFAQAESRRKTRLAPFAELDANRKVLLEETPFLSHARGGGDNEEDLLNMLDPATVAKQRDGSLRALAKAQNADGGFPWWPGGPSESYMTLYVVAGFAKAVEFGVEVPKDVSLKAWRHLQQTWTGRGWEQLEKAPELAVWIGMLYTAFPDASWHGGVLEEARLAGIVQLGLAKWKDFSPYTKAYLALLLKRRGQLPQAKLVFDSVMDSAKTDDQLGTYWAPEDRAWLWYRDSIESHAWALRTLAELNPQDPRAEGLVQWLFLNKKLNQWKSTRATAETLYALAYYMKTHALLGKSDRINVQIGDGGEKKDFVFGTQSGQDLKYQWKMPGAQVTAKKPESVHFDKQGPGIAFASATWHFSSNEVAKESRGDFLSVERRYFRRSVRGKEEVLEALNDDAKVQVGDEIEVQLSIRSKHAAEYVQLRDPRGSGFEPLTLSSGYKWDYGTYWYEEVRDQATNFFFSRLPVGEYTFKYRLRAAMAGTFRVGSATLQSVYAPEFAAYSAGRRLEVVK